MVCFAFSDNIPQLYIPFSLLLGVSETTGIINSYYVVGVITKKYSSMKYLRLYTVITALFSAPAILIQYITSENTMSILLVITCLISTIVMIVLLAVSSLLDKDGNKDWIDDSKFAEVSNKKRNKMNSFGFSKREFEVCELLIEGHTMRQIAAILGISYSTVNTYCTSIYRKVGINSRVELLKIFQNN